MNRAFATGRRVRFLTLTDGPAGTMTIAELYEYWHRLRIKLRRMNVLDEYAAVVEAQQRGALHLHVLTTGKYIPHAELKRLARWAGFRGSVDIREVKRSRGGKKGAAVASYVAKDLASYVSKDGESIAAKVNVRRRPVRFSRGWGCSIRVAEKLIAEEIAEEYGHARDPGPWVILRKAPDGSLIAMNQAAGIPRCSPQIANP